MGEKGEPMSGAQEQASKVARFRSVLIARYDDGSWREDAACRDVDTELFFPVGSGPRSLETTEIAKAVCAGCPVQVECLKFAVATNQQYGIWGGCDEEERRVLRRRWRSERLGLGSGSDVAQPAAS